MFRDALRLLLDLGDAESSVETTSDHSMPVIFAERKTNLRWALVVKQAGWHCIQSIAPDPAAVWANIPSVRRSPAKQAAINLALAREARRFPACILTRTAWF